MLIEMAVGALAYQGLVDTIFAAVAKIVFRV